jgi:LPXTG-site transpeptidase (sortase) family protein
MYEEAWQPTSYGVSLCLITLIGYGSAMLRFKHWLKIHDLFSRVSSYVLIGVSLAMICAGAALSYQDLNHNRAIKTEAVKAVAASNKKARSTANKPAVLSGGAPSTVQVSTNDLSSYTVAPNMPRYLLIPKLSVDARILSAGLSPDGSISTPGNVFDTAWYDGSSLPGQPGAMLIDGHISSWTSPGVFYRLDELSPGDEIQVERGDGAVFTYRVVKTEVYASSAVNMQAVLNPVNAGSPGLNLISCYGSVIPGTNEFNKRIVVFASE